MKDPANESDVEHKSTLSVILDFIARIFPWLLVIVAFAVFYSELRDFVQTLNVRARQGASVKLGAFEFGALKVEPQRKEPETGETKALIPDNAKDLYNHREAEYHRSEFVMLVHTVARSNTKNDWYDVRIFLEPHRRPKDSSNPIDRVEKVQYYFGAGWNNQVFESDNRCSGFAVVTSAYGPFLASANVFFKGSKDPVTLFRYINFEMGDVGPTASGPKNDCNCCSSAN